MKDTRSCYPFLMNRNRTAFCLVRYGLISVFVIFILTVTIFPAKAQGVQVVRVGVYENAPKIFTAEDGTVSGFWADLVRYIAAKEGWEIEWVHGSWDECLDRLKSNEIDMMPDMSWSESRAHIYVLSEETVLVSWSRVYVPRGSDIETILDLNGKTVAVLANSANYVGVEGIRELSRRFDLNVFFWEANSYDELFQALEDNRVDAGVTNKDFGNINEDKYRVDRTPILFRPSRIVFGFNQKSNLTPELFSGVDRQMHILKDDSSSVYYHLQDKWLGAPPSVRVVLPPWLLSGFGVALSLFVVFFTFSMLLRQQVAEKTHVLKRYAGELETLNAITMALSSSLELDEVLELILDQIGLVLPMDSGAIFLHEKDGVRVMVDRGIIPSAQGRVFPADSKLFGEIEKTGKPLVLGNVKGDLRFENWGQSADLESWIGIPLIVRDTLIGFLTLDSFQPNAYSPAQANLALSLASQAAQAISNARQFDTSQRRAEQLAALRKIDQAIVSSFDIKVTLSVLLEHVIAQLNVDAARVLIYQENLQILTFSQAQGFRILPDEHMSLRLGQGLAGKVALKREPIFIPDLYQAEVDLSRSPEFIKEGFVAYSALPLVAKGGLVGVLEIFHRSSLALNQEWINFSQVLAGQATIAIDNIDLFNNLQYSNIKLMQAYDATIEGWAQALELRDLETEGHSRRVVALVIDLAQKLGISGEDLVHIRRGALLHDIGKMGIPDSILKKADSLNAAEWEIMKQHPQLAYEFLKEVDFLKPALDIPSNHHEKWDGTGYPRGLKGEEIPIAARLFAIVDVWDALRSDRPYRKAWSVEKTLTYIQEESGKHFDPEVVDVFLKLISSE